MSDSFSDRISELQDQVGDGDLVGTVSNSLAYAAAQETGTWVTGPNAGSVIKNYTTPGTSKFFLGGALLEGSTVYMEDIANSVLDEGPKVGMGEAMDHLIERTIPKTPLGPPDKEPGDLRANFKPSVEG